MGQVLHGCATTTEAICQALSGAPCKGDPFQKEVAQVGAPEQADALVDVDGADAAVVLERDGRARRLPVYVTRGCVTFVSALAP